MTLKTNTIGGRKGRHTDYNPSVSNLVDILPLPTYTCDEFGYITSYNQAAVELWGRAPKIGRDLWCGSWKLFRCNGDPLSLDECPMAITLKTGIAIHGEEIVLKRPDGKNVTVKAYPSPTFDDNARLTGAINTLVDITESRTNEAEKTMLAAIIASADVPIISKTLEGIIMTWNKAAEQLFGYTFEEVLGKSITILIPKERLQEETMILQKIRNGEKVEHYETYRRTSSGIKIPVALTISPIKNSLGQIIGASKIVQDITSQKEFEDKLHRYTDQVETLNTVGKIISETLDVEDIVQTVTDATTRLTGAEFGAFFYNTVDERGESYLLYTLSGVPKEAFEKFGMTRNTAVFNPTFAGEGVIRVDDITKDPRYGKNHPHFGMPKGHLPVVSYLAVPVISKNGGVIGGLFYGHPEPGKFTREHENLVVGIANQASVALDNAKLYDEIQKLNVKKDEFIGLASHELKTPVTSLNGYLQIISKRLPKDDANKPFIDRALAQIGKLSGLISDLLDISKIETGQLPLTFAPFDLVNLVDDVIEQLRFSTKSHQIVLISDIDHLPVIADQQRIEQVVINLLSNAIKYSPKAELVNVFISTLNGIASISFQDFGMGIASAQQEKIFSRFYRVDEMAGHIAGLGIGLFITKEIITRHNGKIWVESEPGKGSKFTVEIPIQQGKIANYLV